MREHLCKSCTTCKCSLTQTDISKTFKNKSKYINGDLNVPIIQTENIFIFKFGWISSSLCDEPSAYEEFRCAPLFQFVRCFLFDAPSFLHTGWQNGSTKCSGKGKYRLWAAFWRPSMKIPMINKTWWNDTWYTVSSWSRNGENINGIDRRRELFCKIYQCKMKRWEK